MKASDSREIIAAVKIWQSRRIHLLTCRRVSSHRLLEPVVEDGQVVLRCPDCEYRQTWIPQAVVKADLRDGAERGILRGWAHRISRR